MASKGLKDFLVCQDSQVLMVCVALKVKKEVLEILAEEDHLETEEWLEAGENYFNQQEINPVSKFFIVAFKVHQDCLENLDEMAMPARKVSLEILVSLEKTDPVEGLESKERRVMSVCLD